MIEWILAIPESDKQALYTLAGIVLGAGIFLIGYAQATKLCRIEQTSQQQRTGGQRISWNLVRALGSICALILGLWVSTQLAAVILLHAKALGAPWTVVWGYRVYRPWQYAEWYWRFAGSTWEPFIMRAAWPLLVVWGLTVLCIIGWSMRQGKRKAQSTAFGSAEWATPKDVAQAGLLDDQGIIIGQYHQNILNRRQYLRHNGPQHVMVFAPTRAGKTAGIAIPTLLTVGGSVICIDIKGELWEATAGYRSTFSHCIRYCPTDPRSAKKNPFLEVRKGENEVRDMQGIADILVDPEGSNERRDHWQLSSHSLLTGVGLHMLYAEPDKTLAGMATFLSDPKRTFLETLMTMLHTQHVPGGPHPVVAGAVREALNKSPNELSGVHSTAMSFLNVYRDPLVAQTLSTSEFSLTQIRESTHPVSLYLVIPPSDLSRLRQLLRLMLNQMGRRLTEDISPGKKHPLLLVMDEFPALGHLEFFETQLAFLAGYGVRALLIAQSLNQLDKAYGQNHSLLDNCHLRVAMAANDDRTAQRISALLGQATQTRTQHSTSGNRWGLWLDHRSISEQESGRPLLTPGEVMTLPEKEELVLMAGYPPIRATKLQYFTDKRLRKRMLPPPHTAITGDLDVPDNPWATEGPKPVHSEEATACPTL